MVSNFWFLAVFGHQAASHSVVVVLTDLWFVRSALMFATGQGQGRLTDTSAVDPLQRQANANHQEVER